MKRMTESGEEIEIKDLSDSHLTNIYKILKKLEIDGFTVISGGGYTDADMGYGEQTYYGDDIYKQDAKYSEIKKEYIKRFIGII